MGMGHLWLKWVGHLDLNGWDFYRLDGWDSYGKVSYSFLGDMHKKNTGLQESTLLVPLMGTVTARDRDRGTEKMTEKQG